MSPKTYPRFTLGGHLQFQLDDGGLRAGSAPGGNPVRNGIGIFPTDTKITPRRLRLYPKLHLGEDVMIVNETDFDADGFEAEELKLTPLDLYLHWQIAQGHHLRIGQAKVPFGHEFLRSSRTLTTIERSDSSRTLFQRDIGLAAFGEVGKFGYGVGVYQGQGQNESDNNGVKDVVAKATYQVTPQLKLGASGHIGSYQPPGTPDNLAVRRAGVEAIYENGPWIVEGEYIVSDGYNLFKKAEAEARGYYIYVTRKVREDLDAVVGYDRFDPDLSFKNPLKSDNAVNDRDRFTLGLNYYFSRKPIHRIMLNYEFRNELEGPSVSSNGVRVRYQFVW